MPVTPLSYGKESIRLNVSLVIWCATVGSLCQGKYSVWLETEGSFVIKTGEQSIWFKTVNFGARREGEDGTPGSGSQAIASLAHHEEPIGLHHSPSVPLAIERREETVRFEEHVSPLASGSPELLLPADVSHRPRLQGPEAQHGVPPGILEESSEQYSPSLAGSWHLPWLSTPPLGAGSEPVHYTGGPPDILPTCSGHWQIYWSPADSLGIYISLSLLPPPHLTNYREHGTVLLLSLISDYHIITEGLNQAAGSIYETYHK